MDSDRPDTPVVAAAATACSHHPPPIDGGECPICLGLRFLPLAGQREFFFYNLTVSLIRTVRWGTYHLIDSCFANGRDVWERLACSPSVWDLKSPPVCPSSLGRPISAP